MEGQVQLDISSGYNLYEKVSAGIIVLNQNPCCFVSLDEFCKVVTEITPHVYSVNKPMLIVNKEKVEYEKTVGYIFSDEQKNKIYEKFILDEKNFDRLNFRNFEIYSVLFVKKKTTKALAVFIKLHL